MGHLNYKSGAEGEEMGWARGNGGGVGQGGKNGVGVFFGKWEGDGGLE